MPSVSARSVVETDENESASASLSATRGNSAMLVEARDTSARTASTMCLASVAAVRRGTIGAIWVGDSR